MADIVFSYYGTRHKGEGEWFMFTNVSETDKAFVGKCEDGTETTLSKEEWKSLEQQGGFKPFWAGER